MSNTTTTTEIKRLLKLSEIAQDKIEFNHNGTRVTNPMQQAPVTRLYNRAHKLAMDSGVTREELVSLHRSVLEEMRAEKQREFEIFMRIDKF